MVSEADQVVRGPLTVQDLVAVWWVRHRDEFKLYPAAFKYLVSIKDCRTTRIAANALECPDGHVSHVRISDCTQFLCPTCSPNRTAKWVARKVKRLLPVHHHHLVVVAPQSVIEIWRYNRKQVLDILFAAVSYALQKALYDQFGIIAGIIVVVHTWTDTLWTHLHLHFAVTAGLD